MWVGLDSVVKTLGLFDLTNSPAEAQVECFRDSWARALRWGINHLDWTKRCKLRLCKLKCGISTLYHKVKTLSINLLLAKVNLARPKVG